MPRSDRPEGRRPSRLWAAALGAVLLGFSSVAGAQAASAFAFVAPGPSFPDSVAPNQTFSARLGLANLSTAPESTTHPVPSVGAIDLVPSCDNPATDCPGGAEAGVFALGATAVGVSGPTSCAGTWTITEYAPGVFRFTPPGGENTLALPTGGTCLVDYSVTTLRLPTHDIEPPLPAQTAQVASVTLSAPGLNPSRTAGYDVTTVSPTSPPSTTTTTAPTTTTTRPPTSTSTSTTTTTKPPAPPRAALVSAGSGKVMQAPTSSGSQIVQWSWDGGADQQWRLVLLGGDIHAIVSAGTGMALDVAEASTVNGGRIVQSPWQGTVSQWWRVVPFGPDSYLFISVHSGKVIDVAQASTADGAPLLQWTWNGGANQIWVKVGL